MIRPTFDNRRPDIGFVPGEVANRVHGPRRIELLAGLCLTAVALGAACPATHAQANEWAWMAGTDTSCNECGTPTVYGTLGVPDAANSPGYRDSAAIWTDKSGNFWLFSGEALDSNGLDGHPNDLWEFNPATEEWTWMGGSKTLACSEGCSSPAVWGKKGTPAAANIPLGRQEAATWTDNGGNLWLFGGGGTPADGLGAYYMNDLWKFDPSTKEWTWVAGSNELENNSGPSGVYGTLGVPATGNTPGNRMMSATWIDKKGNLWLFGGLGVIYNPGFSYITWNDLWEFNPSTLEWAWMGGSKPSGSISERAGVYGTQGVFAPANIPGSRSDAVSWVDKAGNFWLFGGAGYDSTQNFGYLNELWEFNPSTLEWAWMGGNSTIGPYGRRGVYGQRGIPAAGNIPGGRNDATAWTDSSGNFWLFGGMGEDSTDDAGLLNDLWEFNTSSLEWTWIDGSKTVPCGYCAVPGVYGKLGTPARGNVPGGREATANWTDKSGNFWFFGGMGGDASGVSGDLNDLWTYQPAAPPPAAAMPAFKPGTGTYITVQSVTLSDATKGATIYYTTDGKTIPTKTTGTPYTAPITVSTTETIMAIAVAPGYGDSAVASAKYTMNLPVAAAPTFKPSAGVYGEEQWVALASGTKNAVIFYTTNGAAPTVSSTKYTGPILVRSSETVKAIAAHAGEANSAVSSAEYTLAGSPEVITGVATSTPGSQPADSATLTASVNDFGAAAHVWFRWGGSSTALNSSTAKMTLAGSMNAQSVSATITGLTGTITYYFQPVASSMGGTSYGAIQSFVAEAGAQAKRSASTMGAK